MADTLNDGLDGLDIEIPRGPNRHAANMNPGFLPAGDHGPDQITRSGCQPLPCYSWST
jgi:hypothetical protein